MKDGRMDILTLTDQFSIWNAACGFLGRALPLAGGASVVLRLSEPCAETAFWSEEASSGICARLEMLDFAGLTGEAFDMASLSALDPELSDEIARAGLAALLPLWGAGDLRASQAPETAELWLRAEITHAGGGTSAVLLAGSQAAFVRALVARGITELATASNESLAAQIPVPVTLESGGLEMRMGALESLRPGDCLMAGPVPDVCCLRAGRWRIEAQKIEEEWKVTRMSDAPEDMPVAAKPVEQSVATEIGDIPVTVAFTIAEGELPLSAVSALTPGGVFPLSPPETGPGIEVALSVNGRKIGTGHIITLDEQPVVRIASLFGAGGDD